MYQTVNKWCHGSTNQALVENRGSGNNDDNK